MVFRSVLERTKTHVGHCVQSCAGGGLSYVAGSFPKYQTPHAGRESTYLLRVSSMYQTMLETVAMVGFRGTRLVVIANRSCKLHIPSRCFGFDPH